MGAEVPQSRGVRSARSGRRRRRNPLRTRGQDAHRVFLAVLVTAVLGLPVLGLLAGRAQFDSSLAHSRALAARNHPVAAQLQQNVYSSGPSPRGSVLARVSWTAADGTARSGAARVQESGDKGERVTVWLDPAGNPAAAPAPHTRVVFDAVGTAAIAVLGGIGALLVLFAVENLLFTRARMGAWARDWERTAPDWT